jgi:hypothetical protein
VIEIFLIQKKVMKSKFAQRRGDFNTAALTHVDAVDMHACVLSL